MLRRLVFLLVVAAIAPAVVAQEAPVALDVQPSYVAMFKNGLGLAVVRAEVPAAGVYRIAPLPNATLGSLWLSWTPGLVLRDITAAYAEHTHAVPAASVVDILRANIGRTVELKTHDQEAWLTAEIVAMPDVTPQQPTPPPISPPNPPQRGDLLVLRLSGGGTMAMAPGRVVAVRQPEGNLLDTVARNTTETSVRFTAADGRGRDRSVALSYLAQGIAWSPSYVVEIDAEDRARLSAKAVVVNDLIDLNATRLELIAGFPNIEFGNALSAMSLQPLTQILNQIRSGGDYRSNQPAIFEQRVALDEIGMPSPTMPATPVGGEATEDLYFYELPAVTLKRGERGYFPLFAAAVPYTDLYTWDLPDFVDQYDQYQTQPSERREVVWHALKLTNTTEQPWTTAPAMTMKDGRVLGQSTLLFTPPQGTSRLRITQAVSIKAEQAELEVERRRDAVRFHNNTYDEVILEGTLSLTNYKAEAVTVEITKILSGEVDAADGDPALVKLAQGMRRVNPRSRLTWTVAVPAGADRTVTLTYRYRFYTR